MDHYLSLGARTRPKLASLAIVLLVPSAIVRGPSAVGEPSREPPSLSSRNGLLELTLGAGESTVDFAGRRVAVPAYDGTYLPPTLRVRPGDVIRLLLVNRLGENTNLHTHGLEVSPRGMSDDSFRHVYPGHDAQYEIRLPKDHPAGLFWYHPHPHAFSDRQVRAGMAGALIVEGLLDSIPALRGIRERLLLLKATQIEQGKFEVLGIGKNVVRTINGQEKPVIAMRPGETQLWRIANVTADLYYRLSLSGHSFGIVARDGHLQSQVEWVDTLVLSPAARAEVLVRGGAAGTYVFRDGAINTGPAGNRYAGVALASVVVAGGPVAPRPLPTALRQAEDWRPKVTGRRTIVYTESADGDTFFIDKKQFDPSRTDVRLQLGAVEEWTIRNETDEAHNFHIHQTRFQVTAVNGVPRPPSGMLDVVDVPIRGEVSVVIPFTNPVIVGRFLFHCHLLSHEDRGMMATIEVTGGKSTTSLPPQSGSSAHRHP